MIQGHDQETFTRFCDLRETITENFNHDALIPHLCARGLHDFLKFHGAAPVVSRLEKLGPMVMPIFLEALEEENQHLGHKYILSLLRNSAYADQEDLDTSSQIQERIHSQSIMEKIKLGMKLSGALIPHLLKKRLLTSDEVEMLENCTTVKGNTTLLKLFDTKGPTAYLLFVQCLKDEDTHITHQELFTLICGDMERQIRKSRKRKAGESYEQSMTKVTKRLPDRLKLDGKLNKDEYLDVIQKIRLHHLRGEWTAVDRIVEECSMKSTDFYVAVLLESCTGFITQKDGAVKKVEKTVEKARQLCTKLTKNCHTYLKGRCEWTLAKLYRYSNRLPEALHCIRMARHIQYNIVAGEDTALANYCYGCILLESLATMKRFDPQMEKEAQRSLELAIAHASSGDYGLDLSHPKIRLAQLFIGSSPHSPGTYKDPEQLRKAHASLTSVELASLAPRTQCIYYYTESDLNRGRGDVKNAIHSAQKALSIANSNEFTKEMELVQNRITDLMGL